MATNTFFTQGVKTEQFLYEDIIIESLKMYGQDVYYLPREIVVIDNLLNEDVESRYGAAYIIEMYIENTDGFEGEGDILSKFGVELRDQATFIVAKRRWEQLADTYNNDITYRRPKEGDLIYLPLSKSVFEVKFVEHEQPFYQLQNLPTYKLQCELFEYTSAEIETGYEEVDDVLNPAITDQTVLGVNSGNNINFIVGETVEQTIAGGVKMTAKVAQFGSVDAEGEIYQAVFIINPLADDGKYHEFIVGSTITGLESGATWTVFDIFDIEDTPDKNMFPNDPLADNQAVEYEADNIIDFSEGNPFGEIS